MVQLANDWDNVGFYRWHGEFGAYLLVESWFDPDLVFSPIEVAAGDIVEYIPSQVSGGAEYLACGEIKTLDPVQVTAPLSGVAFLRRVGFGGGGRRIAVSQAPRAAAIPAPAACNSDPVVREQAASVAVRSSLSPALCAANRVSITQSGHGTTWQVSFPGGTTPGIYRWGSRVDGAECRASTFLIEESPPQC